MREGAYSNLALKEALKNTEHNHAARITALVYCTVEHCSYADYLIAHYAKGRIHGSVRIVLQMGIAEMLFMNTPDHVVCSESVKLIRSIGKVVCPAMSTAFCAALHAAKFRQPT